MIQYLKGLLCRVFGHIKVTHSTWVKEERCFYLANDCKRCGISMGHYYDD